MQHPVDVRFAKPASQLTEQEIHAMTKDELQRLLYTSGPYHPVSHRIPAYADRGDLIRMALTPTYGVRAYAARVGDPCTDQVDQKGDRLAGLKPVCIKRQLGISRRVVRSIHSGEPCDLAGAGARVVALRIALLADF